MEMHNASEQSYKEDYDCIKINKDIIFYFSVYVKNVAEILYSGFD